MLLKFALLCVVVVYKTNVSWIEDRRPNRGIQRNFGEGKGASDLGPQSH
jgi:hypothetical protein